jgi:hypothetical protein
MNKTKTATPFAFPMTWREPKSILMNAVSVVSVLQISQQRTTITLCKPTQTSTLKWGQSLMMIVYEFQNLQRIDWHFWNRMWRRLFTCSHSVLFRPSVYPTGEDLRTKRFNQQEIKDLIPARSLSKDKAELLASRLKEKYIVLIAVKFATTL